MTLTLRRCIALLAATVGFALPASATTFSIDYTDLWYNAPAESEAGWGVNVIQQHEVLFVTLFVYGPDGTPRWYVGPNTAPSGSNAFTGQLFTVNGSYFGGPWTSATGVQVGNITFTFTSATTGTLSYSVNNVVVTKNIVRQTWRNDNLSGNYIGGTVAFGAGCGGNGGILISGEMTVTHSQPSISMFVDFVTAGGQQASCNYSGQYTQTGSLGAITGGQYNCTVNGANNAIVGNFSVSEIRNTRNGFNGRFTGQDNFCAQTGYFGGVKDVF